MREYLDRSRLKLRRNRTTSDGIRWALVLAAVLAVAMIGLFWLDTSGIARPVHSLTDRALSPLAGGTQFVSNGVNNTAGDLTTWGSLADENEQLRQRISQLEADIIELEQARVENEQLRQQLDLETRNPWRTVGAEVLMHSPDAGHRTLTIAAGRASNLATGMAVLGQTGTGPVALVGVVEEVNDTTATVLLITDLNSRLSTRIIWDGESALGLMQGQWQQGARLRLEQVNYDNVMQPDAIVVSAGLTGNLDLPLPLATLPADIPIGTLVNVRREGTGQVADINPYADPDQVRYVWVIRDHGG